MVLQIEHLRKEYRRGVRANEDISLSVAAGEVYGLLGHNGAGKTTLVNQVAGLVKPTAGVIRLAGGDPVANPGLARRMCAVQPQAQVPLMGVSPRQAIEVIARIRGASKHQARARTDRLLATLDIEKWQAVPGERLSGGVRRLTAFCLAAVHPGRVVMLDEPSNDVDPVRRRLLWEQVRALADEGCAVLLVTHNVAEAERSVDRLAVLQHGRIAATGTPAQLRAQADGDLRLELATCSSHLPEVPFAAGRPTQDRQRTVIPIAANAASLAVQWAQRLRDDGVIREFSLVPASLEDVYLQLSGDSSRTDDRLDNNHPSPHEPYPSDTKED
jgi:ABC-2 type transport system ATP-binding protein